MEDRYKRQTAYKISISDILRGKYVRNEGDDLSFMEIGGLKAHRVNILGIIVSLQGGNSFIIDDGTGSISIRSFDKIEQGHNPGDLVLVIGKIRVFNEETYIYPEIVKGNIDPGWLELRRLLHRPSVLREDDGAVKQENEHPLTRSDTIYELIRKMDNGSGAPIDDVVLASKEPDAEKIIMNLLKEGDIFELSPGRLKTLE